jgi:hypothetical protein
MFQRIMDSLYIMGKKRGGGGDQEVPKSTANPSVDHLLLFFNYLLRPKYATNASYSYTRTLNNASPESPLVLLNAFGEPGIHFDQF